MKKIILVVLSLSLLTSLWAQKKTPTPKIKAKKVEEIGKMVVGIHAGLSLSGFYNEALEADTVTMQYTTSVKPALQATFDYFLTNKVTLGFFFSVQPVRVDISHWQFDTLNPNKSIDNLQAKLRRTYVGGKLLYHFKNTEKIDIYSGLRAGALFWNNKYPSTDPAFISSLKGEFVMINRPSVGIIPIGMRIKFTPQIAANFEINASAPHVFSFGACYTIN